MTNPVNRMRPVYPGEILREEFLRPLGLSANALAGELRVDTSPEVWMKLQTAYDLKTLPTLAEIERRVTPRAAQRPILNGRLLRR